MTAASGRRCKIALGFALGLMIGAACRLLGIPSPAPSVMAGALLVVAMTAGYSVTDWWLGPDEARQRANCAGPDGSIKGGS